MDAGCQFIGKRLVDHAVALDPGLSAERLRHDMNPEVRLPARPVAGMAFVSVRLVDHIQALRRERRRELFDNRRFHLHQLSVSERGCAVNRGRRHPANTGIVAVSVKIPCQDLKVP